MICSAVCACRLIDQIDVSRPRPAQGSLIDSGPRDVKRERLLYPSRLHVHRARHRPLAIPENRPEQKHKRERNYIRKKTHSVTP